MPLSNRYPSLQGRPVFVTGGGSGIGATLVAAFAAQGAKVAFVDVAEAASVALAASVAAAGHVAPWWRQVDVRDTAALQTAIGEAAAELGDFQVLVNNVASDERPALADVTPEYFDERMAVNLRAAFFALQAVVPGMRRAQWGAVVNLGSIGWQMKSPDYPLYAMAKSAINGLTRGNAAVLGRDGIRIKCW